MRESAQTNKQNEVKLVLCSIFGSHVSLTSGTAVHVLADVHLQKCSQGQSGSCRFASKGLCKQKPCFVAMQAVAALPDIGGKNPSLLPTSPASVYVGDSLVMHGVLELSH